MSKKAVIDIGSLKTKVTVFDTEKREAIESFNFLTLLGKGISDTGKIGSEPLKKLSKSLEDSAKLLKESGVESVKIIGTEALRKAKNSEAVDDLVKANFEGSELEIIDQDKEAELFFTAVSQEFPDKDILAVDVGGGSVQLIYGIFDSNKKAVHIHDKFNLKTGTYKLQQQYSPDNDSISIDFDEAIKVVKEAFKHIQLSSPILVFGSSCMLDFIRSTDISTEYDDANTKHPITVSSQSLVDLLDQVRKLAPNKRDHFYPEGGYFMYGADYLLINVLQAIEQTRPQKIYPTNLNSSYGLI